MSSVNDSLVVVSAVVALLALVSYVWVALALTAVFRKLGEQGWKAWVPILNVITLLQLGGLPGLAYLLVFVPLGLPIVVVVACHRINIAFGHGTGMTVLAALAFPIWASVLGFGHSRWLGAAPTTAGSPRTSQTNVPFWSEPAALPGSAVPPIPPRTPLPPESRPSGSPQSASPFLPPASATPPSAPPSFLPPVSPPPSIPPAPSSALPPAPPAPSPFESPAFSPPPRISSVPGFVPVVEPQPSPPDEPLSQLWAPSFEPRTDGFSELSGEVSAVSGAPDAGSPRAATAAVPAQHLREGEREAEGDELDVTVITRRRRMAWSLVPPTGAAVALQSDVVLLGRKPLPVPDFPGAQLVAIEDGTVSKTHALLRLRGDRWFVTDLHSTNGVLFATFMGTEVEATPGEEIEAGERFFLGDAEIKLQRSDG